MAWPNEIFIHYIYVYSIASECYNEELLERYKAQVVKMEDYFDRHREILEKVNEYDTNFQKKLELEVFINFSVFDIYHFLFVYQI